MRSSAAAGFSGNERIGRGRSGEAGGCLLPAQIKGIVGFNGGLVALYARWERRRFRSGGF